MQLKDTVKLMQSDNYKERFLAEYIQTRIRYEKLKNFNNRIEASIATDGIVAMPEHDCPDVMLQEQQMAMANYLHILEVRAVIEGVDLTAAIGASTSQIGFTGGLNG